MPTIPLAHARRDLSRLLDRVQAGDSVVISRHGEAHQWLERLRRWHGAGASG